MSLCFVLQGETYSYKDRFANESKAHKFEVF